VLISDASPASPSACEVPTPREVVRP
jgi:hypothetical protein